MMTTSRLTQENRLGLKCPIERARRETLGGLRLAAALLVLCLTSGSVASAQVTEDWRATRDTSIGAPPNLYAVRDVGDTLAFDSAGNIFVAGTALPLNAGYPWHVILKYDSDGNQLWSFTVGESGTPYPTARMVDLKVDTQGDVHHSCTQSSEWKPLAVSIGEVLS